MSIPEGAESARDAHVWKRDGFDHYVEPLWVSNRLFEEEKFTDSIWDPACGFGRICFSARHNGYRKIWGTDIVRRGQFNLDFEGDFLKLPQAADTADNIVTNPPFEKFKPFALHALSLARCKVAMIWTIRTLPAARWLESTPLRKVLLLTPRPSMPPGHTIEAGKTPSGGTADYCWLIWEQGFRGEPTFGWLKRDGNEHVAADGSSIGATDQPAIKHTESSPRSVGQPTGT